MRHPLSTPVSSSELGRLGDAAEGAVVVGELDVLVKGHALGPAVPEDLQPSNAECAQSGVVFLAAAGMCSTRATSNTPSPGQSLRNDTLVGVAGLQGPRKAVSHQSSRDEQRKRSWKGTSDERR